MAKMQNAAREKRSRAVPGVVVGGISRSGRRRTGADRCRPDGSKSLSVGTVNGSYVYGEARQRTVNGYEKPKRTKTVKAQRLSDTWLDFARIIVSAERTGKYRSEGTER